MSFTPNKSTLASLGDSPEAQAGVRKFAEAILEESNANLRSMGAYDTGNLLRSGRVVDTDNGAGVVYDAEYAAVVHEGSGYGRNGAPRPFLASAANHKREVS